MDWECIDWEIPGKIDVYYGPGGVRDGYRGGDGVGTLPTGRQAFKGLFTIGLAKPIKAVIRTITIFNVMPDLIRHRSMVTTVICYAIPGQARNDTESKTLRHTITCRSLHFVRDYASGRVVCARDAEGLAQRAGAKRTL